MFVATHGLGFTNLWDSTNAVYNHYGITGQSDFWLLDNQGNRAQDRKSSWSRRSSGSRERLNEPKAVEKLLDNLEQPTTS